MRILIFLLLAGISYAQTGVFASGETGVASIDTATITDATALESNRIDFNAPYEGVGTLFVSGDSLTGTTGVVTVTYQLYYGVNALGDALWSEAFTLGTVAASLQKETQSDGSWIGETFDLASDTEWKDAIGVKFIFTGTGTQTTLLSAIYKIGK